jgi:segregation and condensation protein B
MTHKKVLEAALFTSNKPLMLDDLGKLLGVNSLGFVKQLVEELQKDYVERGMEIVSTAQGWQMQVRPEFVPKVSHLTPYADMSEGSKRALALVAYKEPILQSEIIHIQGNKAYAYIKELKRKGLINIESKGHTKIISLTQEFERYFGEEKEKIKELLRKSLEQPIPPAEETYELAAKTVKPVSGMPPSGRPKEGKASTDLKSAPKQPRPAGERSPSGPLQPEPPMPIEEDAGKPSGDGKQAGASVPEALRKPTADPAAAYPPSQEEETLEEGETETEMEGELPKDPEGAAAPAEKFKRIDVELD